MIATATRVQAKMRTDDTGMEAGQRPGTRTSELLRGWEKSGGTCARVECRPTSMGETYHTRCMERTRPITDGRIPVAPGRGLMFLLSSDLVRSMQSVVIAASLSQQCPSL